MGRWFLPFEAPASLLPVLWDFAYYQAKARDDRLTSAELDAWDDAARWWMEHSVARPGIPDFVSYRALAILRPRGWIDGDA